MLSLDFLIGDSIINSLCQYFSILCTIVSFIRLRLNQYKQSKNYAMLILLMTSFSLFYSPDSGDSLASLYSFKAYQSGIDAENLHFEPIYFVLMSVFSESYVLWRLSVWGVAIFVFYILMKKFQCDSNIAMFIWSILGLNAFYYQRISLAISLLFWSVILYIDYREHNRNPKILVFALILFCVSYFFHRSMPIYMMVSVFVLFLPEKKWAILMGLLMIPIFLSSVLEYTEVYLSSASYEMQEWGRGYLDSSNITNVSNLNGQIYEFIKWLPYSVMMFYCVVQYIKIPNSFSTQERYFLLFAAILYLLFFLMQGKVAYAFAGKMKMQSIISMTMFLILYLTTRADKKYSRFYIVGAFIVYMIVTFPTIL